MELSPILGANSHSDSQEISLPFKKAEGSSSRLLKPVTGSYALRTQSRISLHLWEVIMVFIKIRHSTQT
jgi:hypothetical protein